MAKKKTGSKTRPGRGSDQFIVRLPNGMRDVIAKMAEHNGRSMNAEIVFALATHCAQFDVNAAAADVSEKILHAIDQDRSPDPHVIQDIARYLDLLARAWGESNVISPKRRLSGCDDNGTTD
ncbi:Arc family DNA-binding protein [Bradyrhizobium sp.]|uniref:Arc family DNA-binding protein n=1 Tax=Bradyrhizobium sp. TaxID=376 RepID=UPI0025C69522|nr:Arc family DNA-binding protein [Bradyrhizobium sp.]MBV8920279.1 Arc family DNA-binding protein [Bradyrhizobium sp.]MBV9322301.1 Arc family DNA-binding protein [Chloroflexota bacterium]